MARYIGLGCLGMMFIALPLDAQIPLVNVPATRQATPTRRDTVSIRTADGYTYITTPSRVVRVPTDSVKGELLNALTFGARDTASSAHASDLWPGANVAYNFASSGKTAAKLSVAAQVSLNAWKPGRTLLGADEFAVPIIGNVAKPVTGEETVDQLKANAQQIIASSEGIYAGLAPYVWWSLGKGYGVRMFGTATIRTNSVKDLTADTSFNLTHGRFSLGAQFLIGQFVTGNGQFNVETAYARFKKGDYERAFGSSKRGIASTDFVLILPIADKVGLLGQYVLNHTTHDNVWRGGVALRPTS